MDESVHTAQSSFSTYMLPRIPGRNSGQVFPFILTTLRQTHTGMPRNSFCQVDNSNRHSPLDLDLEVVPPV